jgi:hypothetical protein
VSRQGLDKPVVGPFADILDVQMKIARQEDTVSFNSPHEQSVVRGLDSRRSKDCHRHSQSAGINCTMRLCPKFSSTRATIDRTQKMLGVKARIGQTIVGPFTDILDVQMKIARQEDTVSFNSPREQSIVSRGLDSRRSKDCHRHSQSAGINCTMRLCPKFSTT